MRQISWFGLFLIAVMPAAQALPPSDSQGGRFGPKKLLLCSGGERVVSFRQEVAEVQIISTDPAKVRPEVIDGMVGRLHGGEEGTAEVTVRARPAAPEGSAGTIEVLLEVEVQDCQSRGHRPADSLTGAEEPLDLDAEMAHEGATDAR